MRACFERMFFDKSSKKKKQAVFKAIWQFGEKRLKTKTFFFFDEFEEKNFR